MDSKEVIRKTALYQRLSKKPRYWTQLAIECYKRNSCEGCFYKEFFTERGLTCKMRLSVIESVKVLGIPQEEQNEN